MKMIIDLIEKKRTLPLVTYIEGEKIIADSSPENRSFQPL